MFKPSLFAPAAFLALAAVPGFAEENAAASTAEASPGYADWFEDTALRVELDHIGTRGFEKFALKRLVEEPIWPGARVHLVDPTGYGKYRFQVFDKATGTLIYSSGYCTLFGEWLTTREAGSGVVRSMPEPLRMPMPRAPVTVEIAVRDDKTGDFRAIQTLEIDPTAYDVRTEMPTWEVVPLHGGDRPVDRTVDIVIVPDGYTTDEEAKMLADARRFARVLLGHGPFNRHEGDVAVRLVKAFSRESGPDEPRKGLFRDTAVHTTFDTFRSPRYLTTDDMESLRRVSATAPYDTIVVMVNTARYGGGGIYNWYSIFPSDSEYDEYVLMHEFGHGFGALGDEYYTSSTGYDEDAFYVNGVEPWEPNLTVKTTREEIKWGRLIAQETPLPTPDEPEFDGVVGLFEGGGYKAKGIYRPTRDSKMFHKGMLPFGPVNEAAIERVIHYLIGKEVAQ